MRSFNFIKSLFIVLSLVFVSSCNNANTPGNLEPNDKETTIDFYALNDFHGAVEYQAGKQTGLSRIGKYLLDIKEKKPDTTVILSSGDMFQGSVDSNLNHGALVTDMMIAIGFDSMTIGNHEFDWGEEAIRNNQKNMKFPLLACNIFYKGTETSPDYLRPYTTFMKGDIKIGVIGAVQAGIGTSILRSISDKFDFVSPNKYIQKYSDILFKNENCDAVVLSTHDGNYSSYKALTENSSVSGRKYIDGLFLGHDHQLYNDVENGVPYVEGYSNGKMISHIALTIKNHKVIDYSNDVISTIEKCYEPADSLEAIYAKYLPEIDKIKNTVVGKTTTYLSKTTLGQIASKSIHYYINKHTDEFDFRVDFAGVNAGGVRSTIAAGNVTYGMIFQVFPFDNNVVCADVDAYGLSLYQSYAGNYSYTGQQPTLGSDNLYHVGTINYVSEIMDAQNINVSRVYSPAILRDVICEAIAANNIEEISPYSI